MKPRPWLLALALFSGFSWGAPIPATSSSELVSKPAGLFVSAKGFRMNAGSSAWIQSAPPKNIPSLVTIYKSPILNMGQQPALTVRVDDLRVTTPLKSYVKRWMKDYTRFGFEVLTAKQIKVNQSQAFMLDILSRETGKQLRQLVFLKEKTAVILTCRDHKANFSKTVLDCNEIAKTFEWIR
jgi:hypothetical protein